MYIELSRFEKITLASKFYYNRRIIFSKSGDKSSFVFDLGLGLAYFARTYKKEKLTINWPSSNTNIVDVSRKNILGLSSNAIIGFRYNKITFFAKANYNFMFSKLYPFSTDLLNQLEVSVGVLYLLRKKRYYRITGTPSF